MPATYTALTALSSAPPKAPDVAHLAWSAITVRVAWSLLAHGVRVRPAVLRDARDHVLMNLSPDTPLAEAEDRTVDLIVRFVARARRRPVGVQWPQDAAMSLSPRWRRAIDAACSPVLGAVFRQHYGDGRSIESLERMMGVDRTALEAARGGLREIVRRLGASDGLPFDQWEVGRLDRLLARLAAWSPGPCPPMHETVEGRHRDHLGHCVRCDRAYRLVQNDILSAADLVPPVDGARPPQQVRVLALQVHPDARPRRAKDPCVRDQIARELEVPCFPVGDDLLIIDLADAEAVHQVLRVAAEVESPHRDHLRGLSLHGSGRWTPHGLIGALVDRAEADIKLAPWGDVEGAGDLPAPLALPPSSRRWWTGVAATGAIGVALFVRALQPAPAPVLYPVDAEFVAGRSGTWLRFDVDDRAILSVVRLTDGELDPLLVSSIAADKANLAVGDGTYRLHAVGQGLLVVSSGAPIADLRGLVEQSRRASDPLAALRAEIHQRDPHADVALWTGG